MSYKVLWVDDEYDTPALQEVADLAYDRGIDMEKGCKSAEEALICLQHPNNFDAVVLDARFYITKNDTPDSLGRMKGLREVTKRLEQLKIDGCYLPTFIYSGQPEIYNSEDYSDHYGEYPLFLKDDEGKYKLFDAIISAVNERPETIIKLKFAPLFDVCDSKYMFDPSYLTEKLIKLAKLVDNNVAEESYPLNEIRNLMQLLFKYCEQSGLLPFGIKEMNKQSYFLGDKKLCDYIPDYVQKSIQFLVLTTQPGSHPLDAHFDMFNKKAPFLFRSIFFSLSTVLVWWKQFIDGEPDKDELNKLVSEIISKKQKEEQCEREKQNVSDVGKETTSRETFLVDKDENGCYHCGPYLMATQHGDRIKGKQVVIEKYELNTKRYREVYPFFASKVTEV